MAIEASNETGGHRRIRLGMVGGGQGAFIGAVHRIAARIDDQFELVAGALASDPVRAKTSAKELGIADGRAYGEGGWHRGGLDRDTQSPAQPGRESFP